MYICICVLVYLYCLCICIALHLVSPMLLAIECVISRCFHQIATVASYNYWPHISRIYPLQGVSNNNKNRDNWIWPLNSMKANLCCQYQFRNILPERKYLIFHWIWEEKLIPAWKKIWKMNMNRAQVWKVKVKSPKWMKINNIENSRNMNRAQVCQLTPGAYYCQVLASVQTPRQVQNVFPTQLYNQPTPPPPMFQMFSNQCFSEKTPSQCTYIIGQPRAHTP